MKMIIAIVDDSKTDEVSQALLDNQFRVTQLATTGGFLRGGSTTLIVGLEDDLVGQALQIIRDQIPSNPDPEKKQATLYVLNVKNFNRV